jgi:hypothetical protein
MLNDYNVCSFGGETRGLLIERCTFGGSEDEHCVRLQRIRDARLRDCTFNAGGKKSALTIRDGANVRVDNCIINGPIAIGPPCRRRRRDQAADEHAGRATRGARRSLRRTGLDYTFHELHDYDQRHHRRNGVQRLTFDACWIKTSKQWIFR